MDDLEDPVVGSSAIVITAELVWLDELVPVTLHEAVVGLVLVQMAVIPEKPLDV